MSGDERQDAVPPEELQTAVARHNLSVLVRHMDEAGIGKVACHFDATFGEGDIYHVGCLYGPRPSQGVADAPPPAMFVEGFVGLERDATGTWIAVSEPLQRFETAIREAGLGALDSTFAGWREEHGSEGSIAFDGREVDITFGKRREEIDWAHGWLRPGEMEEVPAPREGGVDERVQGMQAEALRHNVAVVLDAMQEAGVEEVVIRTLPPPHAGKVATVDYRPADSAEACEGKKVSGFVGVWTEAGSEPEYRDLMPGTLDIALPMLAVDLIAVTDPEWERGGVGTVTVDANGARMRVEREETVKVLYEGTMPPARRGGPELSVSAEERPTPDGP